MRIAVIGAGNMGGAIAAGLASCSLADANDIIVSNPSKEKLEALKAAFPEISVTCNNSEAVAGADIVIIAVKPWILPELLSSLPLEQGQQLVSVAAGISFGQLALYSGKPGMAMFRIIPNTAIKEKESMTLISCCNASESQIIQIKALFDELGRTLIVPEENLAAGTSLASCGIAYVLEYIRAAEKAGTELGLEPEIARELAAQACKGAASLILDKDAEPSCEIKKVCTPGGLTIKGINELERRGFASAVLEAMKKSI